jgi:hypothetical protein
MAVYGAMTGHAAIRVWQNAEADECFGNRHDANVCQHTV